VKRADLQNATGAMWRIGEIGTKNDIPDLEIQNLPTQIVKECDRLSVAFTGGEEQEHR
jgi:hypothetical protein